MIGRFAATSAVAGLLGLTFTLLQVASSVAEQQPYVVAESAVAAGEYLTSIGACNDCHTDGWDEQGTAVPREDRLMGSAFGWHGPWGTSYAKNLRLTAAELSEPEWLELFERGIGLPPMPWVNLHAMSARDAAAIYAFLKDLGPRGEPAPLPLPPGIRPTPPYFALVLPGS